MATEEGVESSNGGDRRWGTEKGAEGEEEEAVIGEDRRSFVANMVPDVEGDVGVGRLGSRGVINVVDAYGVAVAEEPGQGRSGGRKMNGADKDTPIVGCTIADVIGVTTEDEHGRWDRGIAASPGGRHPVRRDEGLGAEDQRLSVGELAIGYASRGAEMDHDLLRRDLFYGSTRASWDRQTNTPHPSKAERKRENKNSCSC